MPVKATAFSFRLRLHYKATLAGGVIANGGEMFTESDLRDYIRIRRQVTINNLLLFGIVLLCLLSPFIGWALFEMDPDTLFLLGLIIGIPSIVNTTPKFGMGHAVALLEKAINSDAESIKILAKIKEKSE